MPFADPLENELINHDNAERKTSLNSSESAEPIIYVCFKDKGLHHLHVNAHSLFNKQGELQLLVNLPMSQFLQ